MSKADCQSPLKRKRKEVECCTLSLSSLTQYKGVEFNSRSGKWVVKFKVGNVPKTLPGKYDTDVEAAEAYDAYMKSRGQSKGLNFPQNPQPHNHSDEKPNEQQQNKQSSARPKANRQTSPKKSKQEKKLSLTSKILVNDDVSYTRINVTFDSEQTSYKPPHTLNSTLTPTPTRTPKRPKYKINNQFQEQQDIMQDPFPNPSLTPSVPLFENTPTPSPAPTLTPTPEFRGHIPAPTPTPEFRADTSTLTSTPEFRGDIPAPTPTPEFTADMSTLTPTPEFMGDIPTPTPTLTPEFMVDIPTPTPTPTPEFRGDTTTLPSIPKSRGDTPTPTPSPNSRVDTPQSPQQLGVSLALRKVDADPITFGQCMNMQLSNRKNLIKQFAWQGLQQLSYFVDEIIDQERQFLLNCFGVNLQGDTEEKKWKNIKMWKWSFVDGQDPMLCRQRAITCYFGTCSSCSNYTFYCRDCTIDLLQKQGACLACERRINVNTLLLVYRILTDENVDQLLQTNWNEFQQQIKFNIPKEQIYAYLISQLPKNCLYETKDFQQQPIYIVRIDSQLLDEDAHVAHVAHQIWETGFPIIISNCIQKNPENIVQEQNILQEWSVKRIQKLIQGIYKQFWVDFVEKKEKCKKIVSTDKFFQNYVHKSRGGEKCFMKLDNFPEGFNLFHINQQCITDILQCLPKQFIDFLHPYDGPKNLATYGQPLNYISQMHVMQHIMGDLGPKIYLNAGQIDNQTNNKNDINKKYNDSNVNENFITLSSNRFNFINVSDNLFVNTTNNNSLQQNNNYNNSYKDFQDRNTSNGFNNTFYKDNTNINFSNGSFQNNNSNNNINFDTINENDLLDDFFDGENGPVTVLHTDVCDAFNLCINVNPRQKINEKTTTNENFGGCVWDIFYAEDLHKVEQVLEDQVENVRTYLNKEQRQQIRNLGAMHWRIFQREGDAVLVPTGCAHQVRNLTSTTKFAWDFASASHIGQILKKQQRMLERIKNGQEGKNDTLQAECTVIQAALAWQKILKQ